MRNALRAVMPTALALFFWVGVIRSQTQHAILRMGEAATESFDRDWRFARFGQQADGSVLDEPGDTLAAPGFDDHTWQPVQLPHDWAITGPFRIDLAGETGKLPWKGIGWYRKHFQLSSRDAGKKIFIDFDGAMAYAEVWLNGEYVGGWPYGYSSFRLDLTPYLRFGGENILAVRLNTEAWDSRWYPGAGLYRHVWLVKTAPVHVDHWGTFITTPDVRQERARVHIRTRVCNESSRRAGVTVQTSLFELDSADRPTRLVVAAPEQPVILPAGEKRPVEALVTVSSPRRWDIRTPNRYVAITRLRAAGKVIDTYYTAFGIRTLAFTARDGFLLNGRRVPIQGTCNHHDLGALGAAVNTSALQRQLRILRAMGCNALRTSHNPPAPELLELADKMGFLVWDEAFDAWKHGKKKNDYNRLFDQWHEKDLTSLVLRDRNHPSVIIWSIGNEVMDQRDTSMTRELADIVHRNDSTRPVSNGYNDPDGGRASGAPLALDVMGVNYFFGQQARWDADPRYRSMPTIGSETSSCLSSRGEYFFGTEYRNWQVSSYDLARPGWGCIPDEQFRTNARFPNLLGEFVWTGFDYLGEPTPYGSDDTNLLNFRSDPSRREELRQKLADMEKNNPPSRSSYFGIIDLCGFPKDRYYLYQAHWRPDFPMAHILPHWNWPERVDSIVPVHVYTSGDEAELFLNGRSLGRKKMRPGQDFRLVWDSVRYEPGEVRVVAYKQGRVWARDTVRTTGAPSTLALAADQVRVAGNGRDLVYVKLMVQDASGRTVPRSHPVIHFSLEGPGEIVATDNGDATSFVSFQSPVRPAYNGMALVIVRAREGERGTLVVKASSPGLAPAVTKIQVN